MKFYIQKEKEQLGIKIGVTLYELPLVNCQPVVNADHFEFNFAGFIKVPNECNIKAVIRLVNSHGADFVFVDLSDNKDQESAKSNDYNIPVFLVENKQQLEFFQFSAQITSKFVTIMFNQVS